VVIANRELRWNTVSMGSGSFWRCLDKCEIYVHRLKSWQSGVVSAITPLGIYHGDLVFGCFLAYICKSIVGGQDR
jgi:hypothetical protein